VRGVNVVQAGERTRLVLNLKRPLNYATAIDGKSVIVTVEGSGGVAQAVNARPAGAPGQPAPAAPPNCCATSTSAAAPTAKAGSWSTCRTSQVAVDVRQVGNKIQVDFLRTGLPATLRRRLDVTDFGTPVSRITTSRRARTCA
jgi:type IV pilus assembly protein PilQ